MNQPKTPDPEEVIFSTPHLNEPAPRQVQKDYCDIKLPDPIPMTRHEITARTESATCRDCLQPFERTVHMIAGRDLFRVRSCPKCDFERVKNGRAR